MARAGIRRFALLVSIASLASAPLSACMTDHDALEKKPSAGGAGGAGGTSSFGGHVAVSGTGGAVASGGHPDDEAPGTSVLSIVHGVVDAPSVVVCFAKVGSGGAVTPFGKPLSDAPLAFGERVVLPTIAGADPATDVLQPFVIAGELDLVTGLSCAAAIDRAEAEEALLDPAPGAAGAGGAAGAAQVGATGGSGEAGAGGAPPEVQSRLRVRGLPAIPAGTLNGGRSYLLVATGCLGGSGYSAPNAEQYCGMGYSERQPTVSAVFVALSRATSVGHVGLQVLHASLATGDISVTSGSPLPSADSPISIVTKEVEGGLSPRPAYTDHTAFDYGSARGYRLEVVAQNAAVLDQAWAGVLARGGIGALEDGSNYALVLIGPRADSKNSGFWNLPAITVVASDPK